MDEHEADHRLDDGFRAETAVKDGVQEPGDLLPRDLYFREAFPHVGEVVFLALDLSVQLLDPRGDRVRQSGALDREVDRLPLFLFEALDLAFQKLLVPEVQAHQAVELGGEGGHESLPQALVGVDLPRLVQRDFLYRLLADAEPVFLAHVVFVHLAAATDGRGADHRRPAFPASEPARQDVVDPVRGRPPRGGVLVALVDFLHHAECPFIHDRRDGVGYLIIAVHVIAGVAFVPEHRLKGMRDEALPPRGLDPPPVEVIDDGGDLLAGSPSSVGLADDLGRAWVYHVPFAFYPVPQRHGPSVVEAFLRAHHHAAPHLLGELVGIIDRHGVHDADHEVGQPSVVCHRVEVLRRRDDGDAHLRELLRVEGRHVLVARESVELVDDDRVEKAFARVLDHLQERDPFLQMRPCRGGAVDIPADDLVMMELAIPGADLVLPLDRGLLLLVAGVAEVKRDLIVFKAYETLNQPTIEIRNLF